MGSKARIAKGHRGSFARPVPQLLDSVFVGSPGTPRRLLSLCRRHPSSSPSLQRMRSAGGRGASQRPGFVVCPFRNRRRFQPCPFCPRIAPESVRSASEWALRRGGCKVFPRRSSNRTPSGISLCLATRNVVGDPMGMCDPRQVGCLNILLKPSPRGGFFLPGKRPSSACTCRRRQGGEGGGGVFLPGPAAGDLRWRV